MLRNVSKQSGFIRLFLFIICIGLFSSSCARLSGEHFNMDISSPQGTYRVMLEGRIDPPNAWPGEFYVQKVSLQVVRQGQTLISMPEFFREDPYDSMFLSRYPAQEWAGDSTLRLGKGAMSPESGGEIIIANRTADHFRLVDVQHGKYEKFLVFDLAPGEERHLRALPELHPSESIAWIHYAAHAEGSVLRGNAEGLRRDNRATRVRVELVGTSGRAQSNIGMQME